VPALATALGRVGVRRAVLVPPDPFGDDWTLLETEDTPRPLPARAGFALVRQAADIVVVPCAIGELDPAGFSLMAELMGRGTLPVLPVSGYWRPFLDMRAAHRMRSPAVEDLAGRIRGLRRDPSGLLTMRQRAREAHDIVLHPELTQERLRGFAATMAAGMQP
jgi:hypothetical protein